MIEDISGKVKKKIGNLILPDFCVSVNRFAKKSPAPHPQ